LFKFYGNSVFKSIFLNGPPDDARKRGNQRDKWPTDPGIQVMSSDIDRKIPNTDDLTAWPAFMDTNPLPDLKAEKLTSWGDFFKANKPWKLIQAMTASRKYGNKQNRMQEYLAKATFLAISRSVRFQVNKNLPQDGKPIVHEAAIRLFEMALDPENDQYNWIVYSYYRHVKYKICDVIKEFNGDNCYAEFLPEFEEIADTSAIDDTEVKMVLERAMKRMPPAVRKTFENLLKGIDEEGKTIAASRKNTQRAKTILKDYLKDTDFMAAIDDEDDDETTIYVELEGPNPAAIAVCLLAFTASYEPRPSEAETQEWCDEFPEYAKELWAHAKAMEGLARPGEESDLTPEDVQSLLQEFEKIAA